jgi:high-affinity iron transporter
MLASLIIVFREAMEAGLIVGVVLAASKGVRGRSGWIAGGVGAGVAGACLVAAFAGALSEAFQGAGQETFTAAILLLAVAMLTWHVVWMAQHGRAMAVELKLVGDEVRMGQRSLLALSVVVAVAVLREGSEVVLFLFGIVVATHTGMPALLAGGGVGLLLAVALSWLLYRGLVAIPLRHLFSVTNGLIALLAAGMAGQAASILHSISVLPGWGEQIWNTGAIISDDSLFGKSLHALIGYSARPSGIQLAAWGATLIMLAALSRIIGRIGVKTIAIAGLVTVLVSGSVARAQETPVLELRDHRFVPDRIEVPAHVKFRLLVKNSGNAPAEFESSDLNREKVVTPGQTITVFLGPLEPGTYHFFDDFHQSTTGLLIAK